MFLVDPAAAARARPHLRRYSVEDPKKASFQHRNISNFRRTASLPTRSTRSKFLNPNQESTLVKENNTTGRMTKGRPRVVGEADSLTGIEKGKDLNRMDKESNI